MTARIVIPGSLDDRLRAWLPNHPHGHERAAIVLFRKFDREVESLSSSPRFVAVDVIECDGAWVISSSPTHIRFNMRLLVPLYFRCEQEGLELGFVHSHPKGALGFSGTDDENERNILRGYGGSNGPDVTLIALILCEGQWIGRTRLAADPSHAIPARHVTVLSERIDIHLHGVSEEGVETLERQEAAFGKPFNRKLQSLRAVVVGAGGTGSPLATLLARSGIGELVIVDGDDLEGSNLNRVRGYKRADVGKKKALTLAAYIESLGLKCQVTSIPEYLDRSPKAVDALATADVIFGCTDDVAGRDTLTQAMYYYCLPLLDVGLTGLVHEDDHGHPFLRDHRARISTILPEHGACLRCQKVVTEAKLEYERALRERPELADLDPEVLREEFYLSGGHERAPGVGPFTSGAADLTVASFMNLVRPYRRLTSDFRQDNIWIDYVHLSLYSNLPQQDPDCFCCGSAGIRNQGEGAYRLGMPALGKLTSKS